MSETGAGHTFNAQGDFSNQGQFIIGNKNQVNIIYQNAQAPAIDYLKDLPPLSEQLDYPIDPYVGLRWFSAQEARIFFGRGQEIKQLIDFIQDEKARSVALFYGQSGVGKSSILHAGLTPRLEPLRWQVIYERRRQQQHSIQRIAQQIQALPEEQATVIIVDQLEEIFTHPHQTLADEAVQLAVLIQQLQSRANIKWILSFRKEYLAEFETHFRGARLAFQNIFVPPLQQNNMVEAIEGVTIYDSYGLQIEEGLAQLIAADISRDRDSNMAPALQILLERMWFVATGKNRDTAVAERLAVASYQPSASQPKFTLALYRALVQEQGLLMQDFLNTQLERIKKEQKVWVDSGLSLDILQYCTTAVITSAERTWEDMQVRYTHISELSTLSNLMQDLRLLSDNKEEQDRRRQLRLAHDSLAPLVVQAYNTSDAIGQRARRILENQILHRDSSILSREDLKVVAAGEKGMRIRTAEEEALVEKSKRQHKRQRLLQLGIISGFLALIAVVFFAVQQLSSASEFEKAQRLEDLADQANDANEKLSYLSQSLQIDDSDSDRRAKFYQAYREHIFYEEVAYVPNLYKVAFSADGNFVTIATKKGEATTLQQYRLHHEQKEIELLHTFTAPPAADVQAMVYSGDGQRIFAGGNDHSLHVWDNQGRKESSHSFGKKNIEQLAVSYDGKVALLHLFGEQELILFDLEKGVEKKRIQMGVLYNNPSLDALYYSEKEQYFELYERRDPYRTTSEIYDIKGQLLNPYIFWGGEETEAINYQIAKDKIDRVNSILLRYESDLQNPSSSSLSKESQHLWTVNNEGYFRYWQMPTTFMEQIALPAEIIAVSDVAVMEAGNRTSVLIATLQNGVYSYELGQKEGFRKLNWIVENAIDMLGTAGNLLAINANRNDLAFYDFEAASKLFNTPEGHTEAITAIAISPSGERVATASQDKSIVIWNVQKGEKLHQATLEQAAIDLNYFKEKEQLLLLERYGTLEILDDASNNFGATKEIATNVADDLVAAIPLADETSIALPGKEVVYILQGDQMTPHALTKLNDSDDYNWIKNKHWEKNLPYFATFSSKEIYGFSGEGQPYFHYESPSNDIEQVSLWKDKLLIFNEEHLSIYQINRSIPEDYALPFETRN